MTHVGPPDPVIEGPQPGKPSRRLSAVWLVPLLALLISLGVAWRTYSDRGPVIEIILDDASGIEAGARRCAFATSRSGWSRPSGSRRT